MRADVFWDGEKTTSEAELLIDAIKKQGTLSINLYADKAMDLRTLEAKVSPFPDGLEASYAAFTDYSGTYHYGTPAYTGSNIQVEKGDRVLTIVVVLEVGAKVYSLPDDTTMSVTVTWQEVL